VHAALSMAESPAGVGSAGGADKATAAAPEALGPGAYGGERGREVRKAIARPGTGPTHGGERASERRVGKNATSRGAPTRWGSQREGARGTCQDTETMRPSGGTHLWRPQRKG